jgi:hypothetical protein
VPEESSLQEYVESAKVTQVRRLLVFVELSTWQCGHVFKMRLLARVWQLNQD